MSDILKYHKNDFINAEKKYNKVRMSGMYNQLGKIAKAIDEIHHEANYMTYDIGFHGCEGAEADNMRKIEADICSKLREVYYICLQGRGEDVSECFGDDDDEITEIPKEGLELDVVSNGEHAKVKFIPYDSSGNLNKI